MNEERYLTLLSKLIGEAENLQNNPQQGLVPQEKLAADHVLALLEPYSKEQGNAKGLSHDSTTLSWHIFFSLHVIARRRGPPVSGQVALLTFILSCSLPPSLPPSNQGGPLVVERIEFTPGRSNLIVKYPGTGDATCAFVGSHMDVVRREGGSGEREGRGPPLNVSYYLQQSFILFAFYLILPSLPPFSSNPNKRCPPTRRPGRGTPSSSLGRATCFMAVARLIVWVTWR